MFLVIVADEKTNCCVEVPKEIANVCSNLRM
jgi:hypothetical protein